MRNGIKYALNNSIYVRKLNDFFVPSICLFLFFLSMNYLKSSEESCADILVCPCLCCRTSKRALQREAPLDILFDDGVTTDGGNKVINYSASTLQFIFAAFRRVRYRI